MDLKRFVKGLSAKDLARLISHAHAVAETRIEDEVDWLRWLRDGLCWEATSHRKSIKSIDRKLAILHEPAPTQKLVELTGRKLAELEEGREWLDR